MKKQLSAIIIILFCISCAAPNGTQTPTAVAALEPPSVVPTVAQIATFSPTLTPTPTQAPMEREALTALCWVECRGMEEQRPNCCASVIDTVTTRIAKGLMTDDTILGTLRYGCAQETENCQFPAYVANGCAGIVSPCPFDDATGMAYFRQFVDGYFAGILEPSCGGYLFYDLGLDTPECTIEADNGQYIIFHNGLHSLLTPTPIQTQTIIEATPLGGVQQPSARDYWQGLPSGTYYIPNNRLNIRDFTDAHPPLDYEAQPKTGDMVYYGENILVYTIYQEYGNADKWLCIDPPTEEPDKETTCPRAVVYQLGGTTWGTLWLP